MVMENQRRPAAGAACRNTRRGGPICATQERRQAAQYCFYRSRCDPHEEVFSGTYCERCRSTVWLLLPDVEAADHGSPSAPVAEFGEKAAGMGGFGRVSGGGSANASPGYHRSRGRPWAILMGWWTDRG